MLKWLSGAQWTQMKWAMNGITRGRSSSSSSSKKVMSVYGHFTLLQSEGIQKPLEFIVCPLKMDFFLLVAVAVVVVFCPLLLSSTQFMCIVMFAFLFCCFLVGLSSVLFNTIAYNNALFFISSLLFPASKYPHFLVIITYVWKRLWIIIVIISIFGLQVEDANCLSAARVFFSSVLARLALLAASFLQSFGVSFLFKRNVDISTFFTRFSLHVYFNSTTTHTDPHLFEAEAATVITKHTHTSHSQSMWNGE